MNVATAPTATEITYGETVTVGRKDYGWGVDGKLVTVMGEETFVEIRGTLYTTCGNCGDGGISGSKWWYGSVFGGVCFQCTGKGVCRSLGSVDEAVKIVKNRLSGRARRARKAEEKATAESLALIEWKTANPELASDLDGIVAQYCDTEGLDADAAYDHQNDLDKRWGGFIIEMALAASRRPLTPNQTTAVAEAIDKAKARIVARERRIAESRYIGEEGEKVTVTGVAGYTDRVNDRFDPYGSKMNALVIVNGTGEFEGVTLRIESGAAAMYKIEKGDTVTITGTVKTKGWGHREYKGIKQTNLTKPKVTEHTPA